MRRNAGFTLIELVVALAIFAMLITFGVPMYSTFLHNQKIRAEAEGIVNGLQMARQEALKLNARVEFILTDDVPETSNASSANPNANGPHWIVRAVNFPTPGVFTFLDGRTGGAGAGSGGAPATLITASAATVQFNSLGQSVDAAGAPVAATFDVQSANPAGDAQCVALGGQARCLRVVLAQGGQARMCDPFVAAASDTRRC